MSSIFNRVDKIKQESRDKAQAKRDHDRRVAEQDAQMLVDMTDIAFEIAQQLTDDGYIVVKGNKLVTVTNAMGCVVLLIHSFDEWIEREYCSDANCHMGGYRWYEWRFTTSRFDWGRPHSHITLRYEEGKDQTKDFEDALVKFFSGKR